MNILIFAAHFESLLLCPMSSTKEEYRNGPFIFNICNTNIKPNHLIMKSGVDPAP